MVVKSLIILFCIHAANAGSEEYLGWVALLALAQHHHITAIVLGQNRPLIDEALPSLPQRGNLRFHYIVGKHRLHPNRLIARFLDWRWLHQWTAHAHQLARDLVATEKLCSLQNGVGSLS